MMEKETKKEALKEKRKQMLIDYPEILNKFVLFLGAGMTVKSAWQKIISDYERTKKMGRSGLRMKKWYTHSEKCRREVQKKNAMNILEDDVEPYAICVSGHCFPRI